MNRRILALLLLTACIDESEPELGEQAAASTTTQGSSYQGTSFQGTSFQGTSFQGSSYQGTSYQGSSYQGATLGGVAVNGTITSKTTLQVWRTFAKTGATEYRYPDRICTYAANGTGSCTSVNLAASPSPLAGATFQGTFFDPTTNTTRPGTLRIGSVAADTSLAMHPLDGAGVPGVPQFGPGCTHPGGCRVNSDLWLYDVELVDTNGTAVPFCPAGGRALALKDTWSRTGARTADNGFTFACTTGTIAKCTRWGYRPFGFASDSKGTYRFLADYHQACIRAATADYCANGTSFTKDGTLVDVWDYLAWDPNNPSTGGFIPRTTSLGTPATQSATSFVWESTFDPYGATELDFVRYQELGDVQFACPDRFSLGTWAPPGEPFIPMRRNAPVPQPSAARVAIDTTTTCTHSELTLGRYLHPECSQCTRKLWDTFGGHNNPCLRSDGAWTQSCVDQALATCTPSARMATHSECTTGASLQLYDSACTLRLCGDPAYASCCSTGGWTSTCTAAANARCTGGREHSMPVTDYGFCNVAIPPVFQLL